MFVWIQVLEEREKLKQEREVRMKKKEYLMKELERLRKQQGEFTLRRHVAHRPSPAPLQVGHFLSVADAQLSLRGRQT